MWPNPQFHADFVTFTEKILNGKLHFCAVKVKFKFGPINSRMSCVGAGGVVLLCFEDCSKILNPLVPGVH